MPGNDEKIIGFFGYLPPSNIVRDYDACIIAGSDAAFKKYLQLANHPLPAKVIIMKTRFIDVLRGLSLGAPYSFDKEAYTRFYPLAKKAGFDAAEANFKTEQPDGGRIHDDTAEELVDHFRRHYPRLK